MGIFDRFRSTGQASAGSNAGEAPASGQDATRLIDAGHALEAEGRLDEAMQCYLDAIRVAPNPARAHLNRGNILLLKGDLDGALDAFRTAIKHKQDYAGAYYNIGNALLGNKQFDETVTNYRRALEIQPDYAEVHCSLGVALKELGQIDTAIASFKKALKINPDLIEARTNLGNILQVLYNQGNVLLHSGEFAGAAARFRQALVIEPGLAEAHYNLGSALQELGQLDVAEESYLKAIALNADYAHAHFGLGLVQQDLGRFFNALTSYRRALDIKPDFPEAHNNLGIVLQELGQIEQALTSYRRALEIKPDFTDAHDNLLYILNNIAGLEPSHYLEQARQYGSIVANKAGVRFTDWQSAAKPGRLRVGLVSGDLRIHSVGHFLEGLLSHINPARIELIAYPTHKVEDELTARIRPYFFAWKPLFDKDDEAAARSIHADGVHILIDVSGHTKYNRLPVFAWKPAPVQVTWLGLPCTTGVSEIDYILGDHQAIPTEHEHHFSEKVWRMPESYLCFSAQAYTVNVAQLPALSTKYVTFGSFNNLTKMNDSVVAVWARILLSVTNSRLYLKTSQLNDADIREQTRQRFAALGISPERLLLSGTLTSITGHLSEYNKIDIALDTFPYPGITTSVEAIWMGVPVLSLRGDRFLSRTAVSIAHHAGLSDWVAVDEDDYVAKAAAFSSNLESLSLLRAGLRQQVTASPLFDSPRFARNFEDALWNMWQSRQTQTGKPA